MLLNIDYILKILAIPVPVLFFPVHYFLTIQQIVI